VKVVAVKFKPRGKIYFFRCDDIDLNVKDWVIVETEQGLGLAWVVVEPWEPDPSEVPADLKKVVREAGREDLEKAQKQRDRENQARQVCKDLIERHKLLMKLVEVEGLFGGNKMIFFFTAENRVDFRKLVKDLANKFRCKVEMRQIGVRNEAKILGGVGSCGRELCCCTFLNNFEPVSVRMAKDQNLSLNPLKISGLCGRLMCCLAYEHDTYLDLKKSFPEVRKWVNTRRGIGRVKRLNILANRVVLEMPENQEVEVTLDEITEILTGKPEDVDLSRKEG